MQLVDVTAPVRMDVHDVVAGRGAWGGSGCSAHMFVDRPEDMPAKNDDH